MTYQDYTIIAKRADGRLFGDTVTSDRPNADFNEIYRHGGPYDIVATIPGAEPYGEIAKKHMGVETLEYQADVDLDIHALSYLQIKNALRDAYYRGYVAGQESDIDAKTSALAGSLKKVYANLPGLDTHDEINPPYPQKEAHHA